MNAVPQVVQHVRNEMGKVVVGQEELRDQCLITLLCQGHALLEGVPGIAKTLAVKTLSRLLRLDFQRVQCTSDLMPADIIGTNVLNMATSAFQLHKGPVFTDLLLVDEVNRMPPRTQAALLECMEEHQVTIDGVRHQLSPFFTVFATQNPVEFEGTYPLPEAQLDRFLLKIRVPYPSAEAEVQLLANVQAGFESRDVEKMDLAPIDPGLHAASTAGTESHQRAGSTVQLHCADCAPLPRLAFSFTRRKPARSREFTGSVESSCRHGWARLRNSRRCKASRTFRAAASHHGQT